MNVTLNVDKCSMVFIGKYSFNFNNPGPINVNIQELTTEEVKQFLFGYKSNELLIDNVNELQAAVKSLVPAKPVDNQNVTVIQKKPEPRDIIEKDIASLKKLLREKIDDIKDTVAVMSPNKVKKLLDMERETKNRKSLVRYLENLYMQHINSVTQAVGTVDKPVYAAPELGLNGQYIDNVSDIVESDTEIVSFNPTPEE